jgi:hypothetical protein
MKGLGRGLLGLLFLGVLVVGLAGLGVWRLGTASGQATVVRVVAPSSVSSGATSFQVQIQVESVPPPATGCGGTSDDVGLCGLASYEWELVYDPAVVELVGEGLASVTTCYDADELSRPIDNDGDTLSNQDDTDCPRDGGFLGSTGRPVGACLLVLPPTPGLLPGHVRFGCNTSGQTPLAPGSGGLLSTVVFRPVSEGSATIGLAPTTGLADTWAVAIPATLQGACVVVGTGSCAPPTPLPTSTPVTELPTVTPGGPTATPGAPLPTATPEGPLATATPLPAGMEAVDLAAACNPVAATYPNATPVQTIAGAVGPAGNLQALWQFGGSVWLGYSPAYPQASDLTAMDFLDVVFICVGGPGSFARPIV